MSIFADNLTAQQIFDHVVVQLALQGKASIIGTACAYRGENGTKCGVGFLLTDAEAVAGNTVGVDRLGLPDRLKDHKVLLMGIQEAHDLATLDLSFVSAVSQRLDNVADDHMLSKAVLYSAFPDPSAPEGPVKGDVRPATSEVQDQIIVALERLLADWINGHNGKIEAIRADWVVDEEGG